MATIIVNGVTIKTDECPTVKIDADGSITVSGDGNGVSNSLSGDDGREAAYGNGDNGSIGFRDTKSVTTDEFFSMLESLRDHPYLSEAKRGVTVAQLLYGSALGYDEYSGWVFDPSTLRPSARGDSIIVTAERDGEYRTFDRDKVICSVEVFL